MLVEQALLTSHLLLEAFFENVSELDESAFFPPFNLETNFMANVDYSNWYLCICVFIFTIAFTLHPTHFLYENISIWCLVARSIQKIPC